MTRLVAAVMLAVATGACAQPGPRSSPSSVGADGGAHVTRVIDGDTIEVRIGGERERVRYIGIDTPETRRCFAAEATRRNRELVEGKTVRLVKDVSETDRYRRLLRYVYVGDVFVNAALVRGGFAHAATFPPDVAHAALFVRLQQEARIGLRGLWAPAACG